MRPPSRIRVRMPFSARAVAVAVRARAAFLSESLRRCCAAVSGARSEMGLSLTNRTAASVPAPVELTGEH